MEHYGALAVRAAHRVHEGAAQCAEHAGHQSAVARVGRLLGTPPQCLDAGVVAPADSAASPACSSDRVTTAARSPTGGAARHRAPRAAAPGG